MTATSHAPNLRGRVELMEREAAFPGQKVEIAESGDIHLIMSPSRRHAGNRITMLVLANDVDGRPVNHVVSQAFTVDELTSGERLPGGVDL